MIVLERKTSKGTWVQVSEVLAWPDSDTEKAGWSFERISKDSPDDEFRLAVYAFSHVLGMPEKSSAELMEELLGKANA